MFCHHSFWYVLEVTSFGYMRLDHFVSYLLLLKGYKDRHQHDKYQNATGHGSPFHLHHLLYSSSSLSTSSSCFFFVFFFLNLFCPSSSSTTTNFLLLLQLPGLYHSLVYPSNPFPIHITHDLV